MLKILGRKCLVAGHFFLHEPIEVAIHYTVHPFFVRPDYFVPFDYRAL